MPANTSSTTLYRIDECPDVMADACVGDDQGNLIFLSIWARDTAVQQFLARLTLGRDEQGLEQFHLITDQGSSVPVFVSNVDRLEKRMTRAYRRTLFGSLSNVWLFDRRCVKPDKANASALALLPRDSDHRLDRLWPFGAGHLPTAVARPLARNRAGTAAKPRDADPSAIRPRAFGGPSARHRRAGADPGARLADPQ